MTHTKHQTIKEYMAGKSIATLEAEYKELDDLINKSDCFGVRDLALHEAIGRELDVRENMVNDCSCCCVELNESETEQGEGKCFPCLKGNCEICGSGE